MSLQRTWFVLILGLLLGGFPSAQAQSTSAGPGIEAVLERLSRVIGQRHPLQVSDGRQPIDRLVAQASGAATHAPMKAAGLIASAPMVLLVRPSVLLADTRDLSTWINALGTLVRLGHSAAGSASHECALQVQRLTGARSTLVAKANTKLALASLQAGEFDLLCEPAPAALAAIMAGDVTAVAVASDERLPCLWDVPTADEVGLPLFSATAWLGLYAPTGPQALSTDAVNRALQTVLADETILVQLTETGWTPFALPFRSTLAHAAFLSGEVERMQATFAAHGVAIPTQP